MFASCGQDAFFEGHVHAFRVLGGVPRGRIRYDNLRAAVERVLGFSRVGVESDPVASSLGCRVSSALQGAMPRLSLSRELQTVGGLEELVDFPAAGCREGQGLDAGGP